jgi:alkylated DNA repair dioxygenase AlkB
VEQLAFALAGRSERVIVDDATGRIVYYPDVVGLAQSATWFDALRSEIEWRHERRPMYDRVVDVPRLVAHFWVDSGLPDVLVAARDAVEGFLGERFNSVGLNLYRDGRDSVAMHSDHTEELQPLSPIALLSLGTTRTIRLQTKERPRRCEQVALDPGSILLMAGASQDHWEHGVPKTRAPVGERLSLAFRRRVAR